MSIKLAVFDFDSTLMDGETLELLAQDADLRAKLKDITDRAMQGELDFFESLTTRVALLKGTPVSYVNEVFNNLPYMTGAKELISELKNRGIKTVCFSGGFDGAVEVAQKTLGYDAYFANFLHEKGGFLTGLVGGDMMTSNSKGIMLNKLQKILNISKDETMAVGDGANDLSMFQYASTKVAFCAKEVLKKEATIIINNKNLTEVLRYI
ncbi:MAG: phosphoserine phosphatase SerB [Candidatus Gastranaerophilales bacterium]|nr:phosphoserine phosphatase SerB [Candidatus Gastranaerophilales bacterium]